MNEKILFERCSNFEKSRFKSNLNVTQLCVMTSFILSNFKINGNTGNVPFEVLLKKQTIIKKPYAWQSI